MTEVIKRSKHERGISLSSAISRSGEFVAGALRRRKTRDRADETPRETPWDLIGQARRLTMLLHDIHGFSPETGPSVSRLTEARRLHKALLSHEEDKVAAMLSDAVDQF